MKKSNNYIDIKDIHIPKTFERSNCSYEKIERAAVYIRSHFANEKPIIIDRTNMLVDGYATYLAAKLIGLGRLKYEYAVPKSIYGKFFGYSKEYVWSNPDGIEVEPGDMILVENRNAYALAKVTRTDYFYSKSDTKKVIDNVSKALPLTELLMALGEYVGLHTCSPDFSFNHVDDKNVTYINNVGDTPMLMNETQRRVIDASAIILKLFEK